jgi:hypothetical protein
METPTLSVKVIKQYAKNLTANITLGNGYMVMPTYCDMIGQKVNKTVIKPGTPITDLVYDPNEKNNCENKILLVQV